MLNGSIFCRFFCATIHHERFTWSIYIYINFMLLGKIYINSMLRHKDFPGTPSTCPILPAVWIYASEWWWHWNFNIFSLEETNRRSHKCRKCVGCYKIYEKWYKYIPYLYHFQTYHWTCRINTLGLTCSMVDLKLGCMEMGRK
jgi:hypothetical protein